MIELNWFYWVLILAILIILVYLVYSGIFYRIKIRTDQPSFGTMCLSYKFYQGSYSDIRFAFSELSSIAPLEKMKVIGIYYDDPKLVIFINFYKFFKLVSLKRDFVID